MKTRMNMSRAGIIAKNIPQTGREASDDPKGLMNQPRLLESVGFKPSGTSSFYTQKNNITLNIHCTFK